MFGSLRLRVPDDWAVDVQTTNLFGNFETKRAQPSDPKARLTILASSTFGSIELNVLTDRPPVTGRTGPVMACADSRAGHEPRPGA